MIPYYLVTSMTLAMSGALTSNSLVIITITISTASAPHMVVVVTLLHVYCLIQLYVITLWLESAFQVCLHAV